MSKGLLFVISGPSGTGKGTVCGELLKQDRLFLSISSTTREKRAGETDGVTYNYTTEEHFKEMIERGEMLEHAVYGGNYYGTPKEAVMRRLEAGEDVLLEIEPQGALKVKEKMPEATLIFLVPPSMAELKKRLMSRGRETMEQIDERLRIAKWEMTQSSKYDFVLVNDDLEECIGACLSVMDKKHWEACKIEELLSEKY